MALVQDSGFAGGGVSLEKSGIFWYGYDTGREETIYLWPVWLETHAVINRRR